MKDDCVGMRTLLEVEGYLRCIFVEGNEPRRVVCLIPGPQETCPMFLERQLFVWADHVWLGLGFCWAWC